MTHREKCADAIEKGIEELDVTIPGLSRSIVLSCLEEARRELVLIEEKVDGRKHCKTKKGGPLDDPNVTR